MTDTIFTKIGGLIFAFAAVLHLARIVRDVPLSDMAPPWLSVVLAFLLAYAFVQYARFSGTVRPAYGGMTFYYASMAVFAVVFFLHVFRVLFAPWLLDVVPMWLSYVAAAVTAGLASYNLTLEIE